MGGMCVSTMANTDAANDEHEMFRYIQVVYALRETVCFTE